VTDVAVFPEGTLLFHPEKAALGFAWRPDFPDIEIWGVDTFGENEGKFTQELPFALDPVNNGDPVPREHEPFINYCKKFLGIPIVDDVPQLVAPRDPDTVREALKLVLAVSSRYVNGGKLPDYSARVKWPHEIGAAMGALTMATYGAASKGDVAGIAKGEEARDGFLWALAVLLGVIGAEDGLEREPVFNVAEMTNHLSGGKQRAFLISTFNDRVKAAQGTADQYKETGESSEAIEYQLGLVSAFEDAIKIMEITDLPFDNDQQIAGLFTPEEAKALLQDPNGMEGKRVLARLQSLEERAS
jgi:hypothetical protein